MGAVTKAKGKKKKKHSAVTKAKGNKKKKRSAVTKAKENKKKKHSAVTKAKGKEKKKKKSAVTNRQQLVNLKVEVTTGIIPYAASRQHPTVTITGTRGSLTFPMRRLPGKGESL